MAGHSAPLFALLILALFCPAKLAEVRPAQQLVHRLATAEKENGELRKRVAALEAQLNVCRSTRAHHAMELHGTLLGLFVPVRTL